ncbi:MAG TPA: TetR/AcrR family transcriptional regulator [Capillibacterium sp.]
MGRRRQLLKQEEIRAAILDAARQVVAEEGFSGLSIRKITKRIDYSPGIVYHYFHNKEELMEALVTEGYERILASIASVPHNEEQPEAEIKEVFTKYIRAALAAPEEYKAFLLNDNPSILARTSLLDKGVLARSPTLRALGGVIRRGIETGRFAPHDPELTAQVIWTSVFGLILKIITERNIPPEQINRLVEQEFNLLFRGLMARDKH